MFIESFHVSLGHIVGNDKVEHRDTFISKHPEEGCKQGVPLGHAQVLGNVPDEVMHSRFERGVYWIKFVLFD